MEEKFRKAMVANASMDNEKSALTYQVELLKDQLEECEEQSALVTKELREKSRDYELLKRSHQETQRAVQLLQVFNFIIIVRPKPAKPAKPAKPGFGIGNPNRGPISLIFFSETKTFFFNIF